VEGPEGDVIYGVYQGGWEEEEEGGTRRREESDLMDADMRELSPEL
jgi:hypothetical protein